MGVDKWFLIRVFNDIAMKLFYVTDAMCSWCYGFSPEIRAIKEHFNEWDFQMVMGGLRPYGQEHIVNMAGFLKEHWNQVENLSGQPFNLQILQDANFIYDTEPAARATIVVRSLDPEHEFEFFSAVQKAFYFKNRNTANLETYEEIIADLDLSLYPAEFSKLFISEEMKAKSKADFAYATKLGVRGFPTLLIKDQDRFSTVSRGYEKADTIIQRIKLTTVE